jgi:hypothetical protein
MDKTLEAVADRWVLKHLRPAYPTHENDLHALLCGGPEYLPAKTGFLAATDEELGEGSTCRSMSHCFDDPWPGRL